MVTLDQAISIIIIILLWWFMIDKIVHYLGGKK